MRKYNDLGMHSLLIFFSKGPTQEDRTMADLSLAFLMALGQITSDQNEEARIASEMMNAERAVFVWQTLLRRS